jgi:hypothetical protein
MGARTDEAIEVTEKLFDEKTFTAAKAQHENKARNVKTKNKKKARRVGGEEG